MKISKIRELRTQKMSNKHIDAMLRLEQGSRENFWNKEVFLKHLRAAGHSGFVAMSESDMAGFVAFEHLADSIQIWNLVVSRRFRRLGVGQMLLAKLQAMVPTKCQSLRFNVRETNLPAQLLLRRAGFWCGTISRDYFIDETFEEVRQEDAYCFDFNPTFLRKNNEKICITDRLGAVIAESRSSRERHAFGVPYWHWDRESKA